MKVPTTRLLLVTEIWDGKPSHRKSLARNLLVWSDLTFGPLLQGQMRTAKLKISNSNSNWTFIALNLPKQEDSAQQNKKQSTKFCVQGHNRGQEGFRQYALVYR